MRTMKVNAVAAVFELEELKAMETTKKALEELVHHIGEDNTLMSTETGEIVGMAELARVFGILDAFIEHRCWEIQTERFDGNWDK